MLIFVYVSELKGVETIILDCLDRLGLQHYYYCYYNNNYNCIIIIIIIIIIVIIIIIIIIILTRVSQPFTKANYYFIQLNPS